jgi:hypothetical protein
MTIDEPSRGALEAAHCWENGDRVPGRPAMTALRRALRLHQARWREAHGHPIGTQPIMPRNGKAVRFVGSRIPLDYARETGANFVTGAAFDAAKARMAEKERHQSLDAQRLWADLLWPLTLCFNVFGELAADLSLADRAVHTWWPDAPGHVRAVRFEHSPGWLDPAYLGNLSSFDVMFELDAGAGTCGVIGVETVYADALRRHEPKPERLPRYIEIAERSGVFTPDTLDAVNGTDLLVMWLDHLLMLSMLQHPSRRWSWGRLVVVFPEHNTDHADACARYASLLTDTASFTPVTLETLLDAGALAEPTTAALRQRYVPRS